MDLEQEFLDALQNADNFNVVGDMLVLNKARMAPLGKVQNSLYEIIRSKAYGYPSKSTFKTRPTSSQNLWKIPTLLPSLLLLACGH